jgi:hypothetical protein
MCACLSVPVCLFVFFYSSKLLYLFFFLVLDAPPKEPPKAPTATRSSDRAIKPKVFPGFLVSVIAGTKNARTKDPETEAIAEEKDSETEVEDWNFLVLNDDYLVKAAAYAADAIGDESYRNSAATLIQKYVRRNIAVKELKQLKAEAEAEEEKRKAGATLIQKYVRRNIVVKELEKRKAGATLIQKYVRRNIAVKELKQLKAEAEEEKRKAGATLIQKYVRRNIAVKELKQLKAEAEEEEKKNRKADDELKKRFEAYETAEKERLAEEEKKRLEAAATLIQKYVRRKIAVKELKSVKAMEDYRKRFEAFKAKEERKRLDDIANIKAELERKQRVAAALAKAAVEKSERLKAFETSEKEKSAEEEQGWKRLNENASTKAADEKYKRLKAFETSEKEKLAEEEHTAAAGSSADFGDGLDGYEGDERSNFDAKDQEKKIEYVLKKMEKIKLGSTGITLIYDGDEGTKNDIGAIIRIENDDVKCTSIVVDVEGRGEETFDLTADVADFDFYSIKNHSEDDDYVPVNDAAAAAIEDKPLKDRIKILERELKEEKEKDKGNEKKTKTSNAGRKKPNRLIADRPTSYNQQKDSTVRRTFEQFMARLMELNFGSTCEEQNPKDPKLWHLYVCMDELTRHFSSKSKTDEDEGPWFRKKKCIIVHDPSVDLKLLGELFKKVSEELISGNHDFVQPTTEIEEAHELIYPKRSDTAPSMKSRINETVLETLAKEKDKKTASATRSYPALSMESRIDETPSKIEEKKKATNELYRMRYI